MFLAGLRSVQQGHKVRKVLKQGGLGVQKKPPGHGHLISCSRKLLHEVQGVESHQGRMREGMR